MSELEARFVKKGLWVNEAKGPIVGRIYTTETSTGTILIALLAVLSSLATAHLWNLVIFFTHQQRSHGRPADGLYKQQQALLRTLPPPTSLMTDSVKIWWSWRRRADNALLRCVIFPLLGSLFALSTLVASITSSYIVDTTNLDVLVESSDCAAVNMTKMDADMYVSNTLWANMLPVLDSYNRDCYGKDKSNLPLRCHNTFTQPNIPFKSNTVPCPFSEEMCDGEALALDSGLLDMNDYFGLNLHQEDRVRFRKQTTCSILPLEGFYDIRPVADFAAIGLLERKPLPEEETIALRYSNDSSYSSSDEGVPNYSFIHSLALSNTTHFYTFDTMQSWASPDWTSMFTPLPSMARPDADISLITVWHNDVLYVEPVNDPLFSAHQNASYTNNGEVYEQYHADHLGRTIGCTQQYQFCLGKKGPCSPLTGITPQVSTLNFSGTTPTLTQLAVIQLLMTSSIFVDITNAPASKISLAGSAVQFGVSYELSDDQWKKEVTNWESAYWTSLQILLTDHAVGPIHRDQKADQYTDKPGDGNADVGARNLCQAQKMRKTGGFANINVFGLAFVVTLACTVALVDIILLRFLVYLSRFRRALAPRIDRWIQDGVFQLQRRAYEAHGEGMWKGLNDEIPTTGDREILRELPRESLPVMSEPIEEELERPFALGRTSTDITVVEHRLADLEANQDMKCEKKEKEEKL